MSPRLADEPAQASQKSASEATMQKVLALLVAITIACGAGAGVAIALAPALADGSYGYLDEDF
jgi:hypothetical protein